MRLRNCAFWSLAIKRSGSPEARSPASGERHVQKQNHGQEHANDRQQEADTNILCLPPKNAGEHCASELQLFDVVDSVADAVEVCSRQIARHAEALGAALGIARKEHHEHEEVDDQE